MWTVPGGRISVEDYINTPKRTESAWYRAVELTLRREVLEETNIKIKNIKFLIDMAFVRPDGIPVVTLSYYADYAGGKVKLDTDTADFAWVTSKEAKKYELIDGIYDEIVMTEKILKGVKKVYSKRLQ